MNLLIKQRVFSWTDTYDVYDEFQNAKYYVKSEFFSIGHQIHVYECSTNREIGVIHQRLISLLPKFDIELNGRLIGTVKKKFTLFRPAYEVDYNGWFIEGNFWGWNYSVMDGANQIIAINKEPLHWGDTYVLDFANPDHEIMGLLLVIAIDAANCSSRNG